MELNNLIKFSLYFFCFYFSSASTFAAYTLSGAGPAHLDWGVTSPFVFTLLNDGAPVASPSTVVARSSFKTYVSTYGPNSVPPNGYNNLDPTCAAYVNNYVINSASQGSVYFYENAVPQNWLEAPAANGDIGIKSGSWVIVAQAEIAGSGELVTGCMAFTKGNLTSVSATPSPDVQLGAAGNLAITASVTGLSALVTPPGTVTHALYGPNDATCTGSAVFETTPVGYSVSSGTVSSSSFTPTQTGTYYWVTRYSGDWINLPSEMACGSAGQSVVVNRATPAITVTAPPDAELGNPLTADVSMSALVSPTGAATLFWRLYGADDATCANTPIFEQAIAGYAGVAMASPAYTPTAVGQYRWVASFTGDGNNEAVAVSCSEAAVARVSARALPVPVPVNGLPWLLLLASMLAGGVFRSMRRKN